MLEESKIRQNETLLVEDAGRGLGYQIIAAMHRLGVKCVVRGPSSAPELKPLQVLGTDNSDPATATVSGYLSAPLPLLQCQSVPSDADIDPIIDGLQNIPFTAHAVVVLPLSTPTEQVTKILASRRRTTILLCPKLLGFRDEEFFSTLISALRTQDGVAWQLLRQREPFAALAISDLCGFLISIFWNDALMQKTLICPSFEVVPNMVISGFEAELEFKPTWMEKVRAKLRGSPPSTITSAAKTPPALSDLLATMPQAELTLDVLPTTTTPIEYWITKTAAGLERAPELDLHFPPSRAP